MEAGPPATAPMPTKRAVAAHHPAAHHHPGAAVWSHDLSRALKST